MNLDMHQVMDACQEAAINAVEEFSEEQIAANSVDRLIEYVVTDKVPEPIRLDIANHEVTADDVRIPARRGLEYSGIIMPSANRPAARAVELHLHVPYTGTRQAFTYRPTHMPPQNPVAAVTDREVILSVVDANLADSQAEMHLLDQEQNLKTWVELVNADVDRLRRQVRSLTSSRLNERLSFMQQRDDLIATLSIPVRHVEPDRALEIPVQRTTDLLTLTGPFRGGPPEWRLTEAVYEQVIKTITGFAHALERRPANALQLIPNEETLRDWLMFLLNANYEGPDGGEIFVGGETENGAGKTDILVRHHGLNAFIGECKFWDGPRKFGEAIEQLLSYTVWRDTKAAIILFINRKNATAAIDAAGDCLTAHARCREAKASTEPHRRRDYDFVSPKDDQRTVSLAFLPVVVTGTGG